MNFMAILLIGISLAVLEFTSASEGRALEIYGIFMSISNDEIKGMKWIMPG